MSTEEPELRPKPITRDDAEEVAREFHKAYEELAPQHGYETREESRTDWSQVPEQNKGLMIATVYSLLDRGEIVALCVDEAHALTEYLSNFDTLPPLVAQAFDKIAFASGRHFGLTNFDMQMEEDDAGAEAPDA